LLRSLESLLLLPHFEVGSGIELCGEQRGELRVHSVVAQVLLVPVQPPSWPPHVRELDAELEEKTHHRGIPAAAGVDDRLVCELTISHLEGQDLWILRVDPAEDVCVVSGKCGVGYPRDMCISERDLSVVGQPGSKSVKRARSGDEAALLHHEFVDEFIRAAHRVHDGRGRGCGG
jgi:hypothetical protein